MLRANRYFAPLEFYCYRQINNYKHIAPLGLITGTLISYRLSKAPEERYIYSQNHPVIQRAPAERHIKEALRNIS
jgi:hypothetical protein